MNPDWGRWITASAGKYFADAASVFDISIFFEGQTRPATKTAELIEFRINGPSGTEVSRKNWVLDCAVNILYSTPVSRNIYRPQEITGWLQTLMTNICVYKFGDQPQDTQELVGILQLQQDARNQVRVNHFGQIRPDTPILQGTVEGRYKMFLEG